eukprot:TRINITY_DN10392_c0_g1_i1.p1 TRINITY_DN10392_c0_g1~~TRINITY_DN10392_c0_g1_i1.p1  ORF type:complete len:279 (+),score=19.17 TRINITY_DN10392_c0_g1_i1:87-923(+)
MEVEYDCDSLPAVAKPFLIPTNCESDLPPGDYVSPNFQVVRVERCFPKLIRGNLQSITNPLFRKHIAHNWYVDPDFPECGFLTRDEAHVVFNNALMFQGKHALEIGSHTGWSTVHLALGGVRLDVIEPQLTQDPRVLLALIGSLRIAHIDHIVNLVPGFSPKEVETLAHWPLERRWSLFLIDGNHNPGYPLNDAQVCSKYAEETAMILFHDVVFPPVAEGLLYLRSIGWKTRLYQTQQMMGVAWRGNCCPIDHVPDPRQRWDLPPFLRPYYTEAGEEL